MDCWIIFYRSLLFLCNSILSQLFSHSCRKVDLLELLCVSLPLPQATERKRPFFSRGINWKLWEETSAEVYMDVHMVVSIVEFLICSASEHVFSTLSPHCQMCCRPIWQCACPGWPVALAGASTGNAYKLQPLVHGSVDR